MVRRRKTSGLEDFIAIASKLPWWVCLPLAGISWFILQAVAKSEIAPPKTPLDLSSFIISQMVHFGAVAGQYLLPFIFVAGAIGSVFTRWQRRKLFDEVVINTSGASIKRIDWQAFEQLIGEGFRRQGFSVIENEGKGPDGGVDLVLRKGGERFLVQCKQWRAMKVGVPVVRELYGVMAAEGAAGGFVVTSGRFTDEARSFAIGRNIDLIDGVELQRLTKLDKPGQEHASKRVPKLPQINRHAQQEYSVSCPRCQATMVRRTAKRGDNAGSIFWGCSRFPECRGVRPVEH